jgi:hypothetical protein
LVMVPRVLQRHAACTRPLVEVRTLVGKEGGYECGILQSRQVAAASHDPAAMIRRVVERGIFAGPVALLAGLALLCGSLLLHIFCDFFCSHSQLCWTIKV